MCFYPYLFYVFLSIDGGRSEPESREEVQVWHYSLRWKAMAESIIRWFIVREKHCSFAETVRLIRQANRAYVYDPMDRRGIVVQELAGDNDEPSKSPMFGFGNWDNQGELTIYSVLWLR